MSKEARAPYVSEQRLYQDTDNWFMSLSKIAGKTVADVEVMITQEFGDPTLQLHAIVFTDGTRLQCEGEHDLPYVTDDYRKPVITIDLTALTEGY